MYILCGLFHRLETAAEVMLALVAAPWRYVKEKVCRPAGDVFELIWGEMFFRRYQFQVMEGFISKNEHFEIRLEL